PDGHERVRRIRRRTEAVVDDLSERRRGELARVLQGRDERRDAATAVEAVALRAGEVDEVVRAGGHLRVDGLRRLRRRRHRGDGGSLRGAAEEDSADQRTAGGEQDEEHDRSCPRLGVPAAPHATASSSAFATSTGIGEISTSAFDTLPSIALVTGPSPREPTTISSASR